MRQKDKPSFDDAILFWVKSRLLILFRLLKDIFGPPRLKAASPAQINALDHKISTHISPLMTESAQIEHYLQLGKIENLRVAARHIRQIFVPKGQSFSFWRQIGPPWRWRGFVVGRELRQGCLIPNIGGGLCQLSNGLYQCALDAGCTIIERHAHTAIVPGSAAEFGRDATVFLNYIDLRFSAPQDLIIHVALSHDSLLVDFYGAKA